MSEPLPYRLVRADGTIEAHIRFCGPFEGREVEWSACVRCVSSGAPQFIEVGETQDGLTPILIGLRVPAIDEPTLQKTVLMVRQYRLLRRGRHEFQPGGA